MFYLFHIIIVALTAMAAIGSPTKPDNADLQAPLCKDTPAIAQFPDPPIASPTSIAVFRDYSSFNCNGSSFVNDFALFPNMCYFLPGNSATLLYITCGQSKSKTLILLRQPLFLLSPSLVLHFSLLLPAFYRTILPWRKLVC